MYIVGLMMHSVLPGDRTHAFVLLEVAPLLFDQAGLAPAREVQKPPFLWKFPFFV